MYLMERSQGQGKRLLMTKGMSSNLPPGKLCAGLLHMHSLSMDKTCLKTLSQEVILTKVAVKHWLFLGDPAMGEASLCQRNIGVT